MHLGRAQYVACDFHPFMNSLQICLSEVRHDEPLRDIDQGKQGPSRANELTNRSRHADDPTIEGSAYHGMTQVALCQTHLRASALELRDQSIGIANRLLGLLRGGKGGMQLAFRGCF